MRRTRKDRREGAASISCWTSASILWKGGERGIEGIVGRGSAGVAPPDLDRQSPLLLFNLSCFRSAHWRERDGLRTTSSGTPASLFLLHLSLRSPFLTLSSSFCFSVCSLVFVHYCTPPPPCAPMCINFLFHCHG